MGLHPGYKTGTKMDPQKTYLFYDIETTGLNKCFDQILQFAAVRTDLELNELERHEIQIRLNPDVIPSPAALLTHRIGITEMQSGKLEIEALREIHGVMNVPGTLSLGYNSLGFDDEFLRFSFYRNLLSPYTHQYQNGCARADLYPTVVLYYLFKNDALEWPNYQGKITLKLEHLSTANQLTSGRAHHAMVDVNACVSLARKLKQHRNLWERALNYFDRKSDTQRAQQLSSVFKTELGSHTEAVLVNGNFGSDNFYQIPAIHLGIHRHYRNQSIWLALDRPELLSTTPDTIPTTTYAVRKRFGEPPFVLPVSQHQLTSERIEQVAASKHWLQENPQLFQKIRDYHLNYTYPKIPNRDVDAALYDINFPTPHEEFLFQRFHLAPPAEKENIALTLPNPVRREQALRIMGRYYSDHLSEENKKLYEEYVQHAQQKSLIDYRGKSSLTLPKVLEEIHHLENEASLDQQQKQLLLDFKTYLTRA